MSSDELETIMSEALEDMMGEPDVDEEVIQRFMNKVLRVVRRWED
jgi:hypothetical protein